ncbi:MAG: hypothetical protein QM704_27135 [Anaeromyxobacteraceae bacterium]
MTTCMPVEFASRASAVPRSTSVFEKTRLVELWPGPSVVSGKAAPSKSRLPTGVRVRSPPGETAVTPRVRFLSSKARLPSFTTLAAIAMVPPVYVSPWFSAVVWAVDQVSELSVVWSVE